MFNSKGYELVTQDGTKYIFNVLERSLKWEIYRSGIMVDCTELKTCVLPDLIRIDDISPSRSALIFNIYVLESWERIPQLNIEYLHTEPVIQEVSIPIVKLMGNDYHNIAKLNFEKIYESSRRLLFRLCKNSIIFESDIPMLTLFVVAQIYCKLVHKGIMRIRYYPNNALHQDIIMMMEQLALSLDDIECNPLSTSYDAYICNRGNEYTIGYSDNTYVYMDYDLCVHKFYRPHTSSAIPTIRELNSVLYAMGILIPRSPIKSGFTVTIKGRTFIRLGKARLCTFRPDYIEKFCVKFKNYLFKELPNIFYLGDVFIKTMHHTPCEFGRYNYGGKNALYLGSSSRTAINIYTGAVEKKFRDRYRLYHFMGNASCVNLAYYKSTIVEIIVHELLHSHQYIARYTRTTELAVHYRTYQIVNAYKEEIMWFEPNLFSRIFIPKRTIWYGKEITMAELKNENPKVSKISLEFAYMQILYSDRVMLSKMNADAVEDIACFRNYVRKFSIVVIEIDNMPFIIYDELSKYSPFHLFIAFIRKNYDFYKDFKRRNFKFVKLQSYDREVIECANDKISKITFRYNKK